MKFVFTTSNINFYAVVSLGLLPVAGLLVVPIPGNSLLVSAIQNSGHVVLFFTVYCAFYYYIYIHKLQSLQSQTKSSLHLALLLVTVGLIMEVIQPYFGRSASFSDVVKNIAGVVAGHLWMTSNREHFDTFSVIKRKLVTVSILLVTSFSPIYQALASAYLSPAPVIANFDSIFSPSRIKSVGRAEFEFIRATKTQTSSNNQSLKVTFNSSAYSGFKVIEPVRDWTNYNFFSLHVLNPNHYPVSITVRFDDVNSNDTAIGRVFKLFEVNPGVNSIKIPVKSLREKRQILSTTNSNSFDLSYVTALYIFMVDPKKPIVLEFDNLLLEV